MANKMVVKKEKNKKNKKQRFISQKIGEKARKRVSSKQIKQITEGLFSSLADCVLFYLLLLPAASFGKSRSSRGVYEMFNQAEGALQEINYYFFKNAYRKLKEKGLIASIKEWKNKRVATNKGLRRLKNLLPFYDEERVWDKNLYIIQYDIPEKQSYIRDQFRDWFLKKLGGIRLQESSYLLFNNPQELIKRFLKEKRDFEGVILISKLTKDGFLGEEKIEDFIWWQSGLAELNVEYREFLDKYDKEKNSLSKMFQDYFNLLKKDPQVPFELLPDEYLGDEAYLLFNKYFKKTLFEKWSQLK
jgi:phenylacetic acid degradation operon negative regulatory protein